MKHIRILVISLSLFFIEFGFDFYSYSLLNLEILEKPRARIASRRNTTVIETRPIISDDDDSDASENASEPLKLSEAAKRRRPAYDFEVRAVYLTFF